MVFFVEREDGNIHRRNGFWNGKGCEKWSIVVTYKFNDIVVNKKEDYCTKEEREKL